MRSLENIGKDYIKQLAERKKTSRAYHEHQLIGLEIAQILEDAKHKSLYIRLAKKYGKEKLLPLAKSVAERKDVRNKGAYFMRVLHSEIKKNKKDGGNHHKQ